MWWILLYWILAMYGAGTLIVQSVRAYQRRRHVAAYGNPEPVVYLLLVENACETIEGSIRWILGSNLLHRRECRIVVVDTGSTDGTEDIVRLLQVKNEGLDYCRVPSEDEVLEVIRNVCFAEPAIGCIYDLRLPGTPQAITSAFLDSPSR
jgi:hypothetical protein